MSDSIATIFMALVILLGGLVAAIKMGGPVSKIFMVLMMVIGILLLILTKRVNDEIKPGCISEKLRNANRGVLVVGVLLIAIGASNLICEWRCDCSSSSLESDKLILIYSTVVSLLGIVLISLGAVISSESKDLCNAPSGNSIWQLGIIATIIPLAYIGYDIYGRMDSGGGGLLSKGSPSKDVEMGSMSFG